MEIDQLVQIYLANKETYESGEVIVEEGTRGEWVYIILEGQVKVTKRTNAGIVTIDTLKKNAIFFEKNSVLRESPSLRSRVNSATEGSRKQN